jgi:hypothetical protein
MSLCIILSIGPSNGSESDFNITQLNEAKRSIMIQIKNLRFLFNSFFLLMADNIIKVKPNRKNDNKFKTIKYHY